MARPATATRRALQPLWNALDAHLTPWVKDGALLCVSGGPDSRALLESVARWRGRFDGPLHIACVDHRTRPEGAGEARAVAARARVLGFDAAALTVAPTSGAEAALREARYAALAARAHSQGLGTLLLAHHADDVAEGALLSWLGAGGGPGGAAPPALGDRDGVRTVRPFLELRRAELVRALLALGVDDWFVDPDARSARARVRTHLATLTPGYDPRPALAKAARRRREDEMVLAPLAEAALFETEDATVVRGGAPPALRRRALESAVRRRAGGDPRGAARAVSAALGLIARGRAGRVDLVGASLVVSAAGDVRVMARPGAPAAAVAGRAAPTHDAGAKAAGAVLSGAASMSTLHPVRTPNEPDEQP